MGRKRPIILSSYHLASKRLLAAMVPEIDEGKRTKGRERERKRKREVGGGKEEGYERGRRGRIRARENTKRIPEEDEPSARRRERRREGLGFRV